MAKQVVHLQVGTDLIRERLGLPEDVEVISAHDTGKVGCITLLIDTPIQHIAARTVEADYKDGKFTGFR